MTIVYGNVEFYLADEANNYAVFQVASQLNCLEMLHSNVTPEKGITIYQGDCTQGPACAIAAGPATLYRNYFIPLLRQGSVVTVSDAVNAADRLGQYEDLQLNGMDEVDAAVENNNQRFFQVRNGYLLADSRQLAALQSVSIGDVIDKLKVGVHSRVQVTSSRRGQSLLERKQLVTQVFCAAAAMAYSHGRSHDLWKPLATALLEANYEAVLRVAAANLESRVVYLTLLGCGAFGNPEEWVADAIRSAAIKVKGGLDIRIICFAACPPQVLAMVKDFNAQ